MLSSMKMAFAKFLVIAWIVVVTQWRQADAGALSLTASNYQQTLETHELVFINFYADWCRFSNILAPIFDTAADKVNAQFMNDTRKVVMAKVNCDDQQALAKSFQISKYPTLKIVINGKTSKREYRGQRSSEAFVNFVQDQMKDPIKEFHNSKDLLNLDDKKRIVIGYFESRDVGDYETFRRAATNLKDDCQFYAGFGDVSRPMHPPGQSIVAFRPDKALSNENDETYTGSLGNLDQLHAWVQEKCVPLVREITFENAEELTEEGLPFLILFYRPNDEESIKIYKNVIMEELMGEKNKVLFLTADGEKFAHPLHHLGKSINDLPLIAIDSFRHMYLFSAFNNILIKGELLKFLNDLESGKLHREFHYGPDKTIESQSSEWAKGSTTPPESSFQKLKPSKNRYTLLRDEL